MERKKLPTVRLGNFSAPFLRAVIFYFFFPFVFIKYIIIFQILWEGIHPKMFPYFADSTSTDRALSPIKNIQEKNEIWLPSEMERKSYPTLQLGAFSAPFLRAFDFCFFQALICLKYDFNFMEKVPKKGQKSWDFVGPSDRQHFGRKNRILRPLKVPSEMERKKEPLKQ